MLQAVTSKNKIGGTGEELQSLIDTFLASGLTELELQGDWDIRIPLVINSRKNMDRFKIKGKSCRLINNVANGAMITFTSSYGTIWDRIDLVDLVIVSTLYPVDSDAIHISGGCFGGGIYNCYIGGSDGINLMNGSILTFKSNHEDFGLTKSFEIVGSKFWFVRDYGVVARSLNSTPAYISINRSDIEMCHLGGIVGGYENITIEKSIIAYNGKTNNGGGINLAGVISYIRNIAIRDCGFEHNAGNHVILDRVTNCDISLNTMVGLSNGVNGFNCVGAIKCSGSFGVLYMNIENNRIESLITGYKGIHLSPNTIVVKDNLNQFVFSNGTARDYAENTKKIGVKEDGIIF